jgi:hypothetical protein
MVGEGKKRPSRHNIKLTINSTISDILNNIKYLLLNLKICFVMPTIYKTDIVL